MAKAKVTKRLPKRTQADRLTDEAQQAHRRLLHVRANHAKVDFDAADKHAKNRLQAHDLKAVNEAVHREAKAVNDFINVTEKAVEESKKRIKRSSARAAQMLGKDDG